MQKVIAIVCADIHLSHNPPPARAREKCWYSAMARPLKELKELRNLYQCPILCAGDIFDHWKSPPELINFALENLPKMWAVPGQHDLPNHSLADIHKSAYWTLAKTEKIYSIEGGYQTDYFHCAPFPWGVPITPATGSKIQTLLRIALVHEYTWISGTGYEGADVAGFVSSKKAEKYKGYDVVITGDNHISFDSHAIPGTTLCNVGSLMRRKSDQLKHRPRVGLLHPDGTITSHYLDCSQDVFDQTAVPERPSEVLGVAMRDFISDLQALHGSTLDFGESLRRAIDKVKVSSDVRALLMEAKDGE